VGVQGAGKAGSEVGGAPGRRQAARRKGRQAVGSARQVTRVASSRLVSVAATG